MELTLLDQSPTLRNHPLVASAHAAGENRNVFENFVAAFIQDLAPEGALEVTLATRAATIAWRLNRAQKLETQVLTRRSSSGINLIDASMADRYGRQCLEMVARWEQGLERSLYKTLEQLERTKKKRNSAEGKPSVGKVSATTGENSEIFGDLNEINRSAE
jgi:hypothetical protein